jgi:hypothetical protein
LSVISEALEKVWQDRSDIDIAKTQERLTKKEDMLAEWEELRPSLAATATQLGVREAFDSVYLENSHINSENFRIQSSSLLEFGDDFEKGIRRLFKLKNIVDIVESTKLRLADKIKMKERGSDMFIVQLNRAIGSKLVEYDPATQDKIWNTISTDQEQFNDFTYSIDENIKQSYPKGLLSSPELFAAFAKHVERVGDEAKNDAIEYNTPEEQFQESINDLELPEETVDAVDVLNEEPEAPLPLDSVINNAINSDDDIAEIVETDDSSVQSRTLEIEQEAELESDPTNIASDDNSFYDLVDNGQGGMSVAGVDMNPVNSNINTTNTTENTNITNTEDISSINPSINENTNVDNSNASINSQESINSQGSTTNLNNTDTSTSSSSINAMTSSTTSSPMASALYSYFGLPDPGLITETNNSQINEINSSTEMSTNVDGGTSESVSSDNILNSNITESKSESQNNVSSSTDVSKSLSKMDTKNYPISTPAAEPAPLETETLEVESSDSPSNNTSKNTTSESIVDNSSNSETNTNQNVQNPTTVNVDMDEVVARLSRLEHILSSPLDVKIVS